MKLVELNEGKKKVLVEGNLDDIVKWLKKTTRTNTID